MSESVSRILIVDDQPKNLYALDVLLSEIDRIEIVQASSGQEALAKILQYDFFLILLDVQMPDMDGFETASLIYKNKKTQHIPIIFLTAISRSEEFIFKGYDSGAVDYLTKPLNEKILLSKVNVFLELYFKNQALRESESSKSKLLVKIQQQNKELEEINQNLKDFSHTLSHDLKNPLSFIKSVLEMMKDEDALSKEDAAMMNEKCIESTDRMFKLIDDMLSFAESTSELGALEQVDLNKVLENVQEDLGHKIKSQNAGIEAQPLPTILGSQSHLYRVFLNLIGNSLKYSKSDASPVIKVSFKVISNRGDIKSGNGKKVEIFQIVIEDNGIGFDEKYSERIFNPFSRLVGDEIAEGSGIGLAAVKKIIAFHCGSITAKSEVGVGSTFVITLPRNLPDTAEFHMRQEMRYICKEEKNLSFITYEKSGEKKSFKIIDESKQGLCCTTVHSDEIQEGMIFILDDSKYEVRWVKQERGERHFGLKLLL